MPVYMTIPNDYSEQRVDNFLFKTCKNVPKSHLYKAIRKGEVRVNKKRVKPDSRLGEGDVIRIPPFFQQDLDEITLQPSQFWRDVLSQSTIYEDDGILAINKPSGLSVHGDNGGYGVIEVMKQLYPQYPQLELAHRLDKETSGCLLLAKKRSVLKQLHDAFRRGEVKKTYYALTLGRWKKSELYIDLPLSRREKKSPECSVVVDKLNGKPSVTRFELVKELSDGSAVLAYPETGRTHQIRVHARYVGHPLAGDARYGDEEFNQRMRERGLNRLFLHALRVQLILPELSQVIKINAPLPEELASIIDKNANNP